MLNVTYVDVRREWKSFVLCHPYVLHVQLYHHHNHHYHSRPHHVVPPLIICECVCFGFITPSHSYTHSVHWYTNVHRAPHRVQVRRIPSVHLPAYLLCAKETKRACARNARSFIQRPRGMRRRYMVSHRACVYIREKRCKTV